MKPARFLPSLLWGVLALGALSGCERAPSPEASDSPGPPSVVLIVIDTLRADRVAAQRADTPVMPALHDLAQESLYYTNAVSQSSWTKPAMVSLFTSLYPQVHNVMYAVVNDEASERLVTSVVPERLELMQTYLKSYGYATAAVQSNGMLEGIGFDREFDRYYFKNYASGFRAADVTDKALNHLEGLDSPFFLYVHYMDPHARYAPPLRYQQLFEPLPPLEREDIALLEQWKEYYWDQWMMKAGIEPDRDMASLSESGRERLRSLYDGEARFVDHELGRLLGDVRNRFPDALVIVTADHGEELWDHGAVGHARTVFDELIHVPLLINGPEIPHRISDSPVELVDVMPTLAAALGLPARDHWQGRNLLASGGQLIADDRPRYAYNRTSRKTPGIEQRTVRRRGWKLIRYEHEDKSMLFNLERDPAEQVNLAEQRPDLVAALTALLDTHGKKSARHPLHSDQQSEPFVDKEAQERIRALGYLPD